MDNSIIDVAAESLVRIRKQELQLGVTKLGYSGGAQGGRQGLGICRVRTQIHHPRAYGFMSTFAQLYALAPPAPPPTADFGLDLKLNS